MRKVIVISAVLLCASCTKDYKCTVTTDQTYLGQSSHSVNTITFTGTKEEMHKYEEMGTKNTPSLTQKTECK